MNAPSEDGAPRPLPRAWLPDPHPPEGAPEWNARVGGIMVAAGPELQRLGSRHAAAEVTWSSVMGLWWKPAAALAAAAAALLFLTEHPGAVPESPQGSLALILVAADGDPVTLWGALGIQADPVLALIAIQEQGDVTGQGVPASTRQEESR